MEFLFSTVPDLAEWIPADVLGKCKRICKTWQADLATVTNTRRMLVHVSPPMAMLFQYAPTDDWLPNECLAALRQGVLAKTAIFDFKTKSTLGIDRPIPPGWLPFNHRQSTDRADSSAYNWSFRQCGYFIVRQDEASIYLKPFPDLYTYYKSECNLFLDFGRTRKQLVSQLPSRRTHFLYNRQSQCAPMPVTHGWSYFNNGNAQQDEKSTVRTFAKYGCILEETAENYFIFKTTGP